MFKNVTIATSNAFETLNESDTEDNHAAVFPMGSAGISTRETALGVSTISGTMPEQEDEAWTVSVVKRAEVMYGLDIWPKKLLPPIPDVPCYTCRARTHLQVTCPLIMCNNCGLYGHQEKFCQK
jgi:hypothetical protein